MECNCLKHLKKLDSMPVIKNPETTTTVMNIIISVILLLSIQNNDFLTDQKKYPRVREAISQKLQATENLFKQKNIAFPPQKIFLRALKEEQQLELWASSAQDSFTYIKTYNFCSTSGILGPKRKQGDYQIPEGFYYIDRFNPTSSFFLSLGINYPNASDRLLGNKKSPGGDIFIHGDCVTIGCIPITDELIKELYVIAVYTKNNNPEKIAVHIFPFKMTQTNLSKFTASHPGNKDFWNNLVQGYSYFEVHHKVPKVTIDKINGHYIIED